MHHYIKSPAARKGFSMFTLVINTIFTMLNLAPIVVPILVVLTYATMGFGLYKMAKACQIARPWMSWIPFASIYLAGEIADHHCYRNEDRSTTYRRRLLVLSIIDAVVIALISAVLYVMVIAIPLLASSLMGMAYPSLEYLLIVVLQDPTTRVVVALCTLAFLLVLGLYLVYFFITFRKAFLLFAPKRATLLTVLSILVPLAACVIFVILAFKTPVYNEDTVAVTV